MADEGAVYVCSKCKYEYHDDNEDQPFKELPDTWTCKVCPKKFRQEYEDHPGTETTKNAFYTKVNKDLAKEAFHYFDMKGDGKLEPKEFKQALQASGLSPSQKEFDSILVETGPLVSYMAYMKAVENLADKVLTEHAFIKGFEPLIEKPEGAEGGCIHRDLLEHICESFLPAPARSKDQEPDKMSSSEIQQVLNLAENKCMTTKSTGKGKDGKDGKTGAEDDKEILVKKFARTMMTGEAS